MLDCYPEGNPELRIQFCHRVEGIQPSLSPIVLIAGNTEILSTFQDSYSTTQRDICFVFLTLNVV